MSDNKLPPTLFIQADNCWRENKNKYVLSFCELLVRENIFKEVHLSFLMVGHTHEDVDAHFSHIASALRKTDVETTDELLKLLPNSNEIKFMHDVKGWLEKHLNPLKKHTQPLHFKISKVSKDVKISYKGKVDQRWKVLKDSLFKKQGNTVVLPKGQPGLVKEDYTKVDFERLSNLIRNVKSMFKKDSSEKWWEKFIEGMKRGQDKRRNPEWIMKNLPRQTCATESHEEINIPDQIISLIDKETQESEVIVRPTQLSRGGQDRTKRSQQKRQKRPNARGKRRHILRVEKAILIHCLPEDDLKKHIWTLIMWTLLQNLVDILLWLWLCSMISGELYLSLLAGDLALFLQVTFFLWMQIVCIHIGDFLAAVKVEPFLVNMTPVEV